MNGLRTSSILIRLVLAWFVLTVGASVASPIVSPKAMEVVCYADGSMTVLVVDDSGNAVQAGHHTLDCPMCLTTTLPALSHNVQAQLPQPLAHALRSIPSARIAAIAGAPLPPRGPPTLL